MVPTRACKAAGADFNADLLLFAKLANVFANTAAAVRSLQLIDCLTSREDLAHAGCRGHVSPVYYRNSSAAFCSERDAPASCFRKEVLGGDSYQQRLSRPRVRSRR